MIKISKDIKGYELVKNVIMYRFCGNTEKRYAFIIRRSSGRDYLSGLVEVIPYDNETTMGYFLTNYSTKKYFMNVGDITDLRNGKKEIRFTIR